MQPVPTPPAPGQPTLCELAVELDMLARGHRPGDAGTDIARKAADRLRQVEVALRVLNRVWTNGLEPAAWITPGPFKVQHREIAEALIPLGYPDPYPATPDAMPDRHGAKTPGGGRGRIRRGTSRLAKSQKAGRRRA